MKKTIHEFALSIVLAHSSMQAISQNLLYYLPPNVGYVRGMVVGGNTFQNPLWKQFADQNEFGCCQTISDLQQVAAATGHPEIEFSKLVLTGNSAGAVARVKQAEAISERVIAVHASHGAMLGAGNDGFNVNRGGTTPGFIETVGVNACKHIPILFTYDNGDGFVSPVTLQGMVNYGRSLRAPWCFALDTTDNHTDYSISFPITISPWLSAVVQHRIPQVLDTTQLEFNLLPFPDSVGWLGNLYTKAIAPYSNFSGDKAAAMWFPDSTSAANWSQFSIVPSYQIPPQPILPPSNLIADLIIYDTVCNDITSGANWRINTNFKEADQLKSDIKFFALAPIPSCIVGTDWVRSMSPGPSNPNFTADPIFSFRVTANSSVYIALPTFVQPLPNWLADWANTGENLLVCNGNLYTSVKYRLYEKHFLANETVVLGGHGSMPSTMYVTFAKADSTSSAILLPQTLTNMRIYPNPAESILHLELIGSVSNYTIAVLNILGKVILQTEDQSDLDISILPKGVYFLKVNVQGKTLLQKFIKQ